MDIRSISSAVALVLGVAAFGFVGFTALAAPGDGSSYGPGSADRFYQARNVMQLGNFQAEPMQSGVRITVTGSNPGLVRDIQQEFTSGRHDWSRYYPNTAVAAEATDDGAELKFTSEDPATVGEIQSYGVGLVYNVLRAEMYQAQAGNGRGGWCHDGGWSMGRGPGWMGGWGPGNWHGPGGMGGWGWR